MSPAPGAGAPRHLLRRVLDRCPEPLDLFAAGGGGRPGTALLESRDGNGRNDTQSLVLLRSALTLRGRGRDLVLQPHGPVGLAALRAQHSALAALGELAPEGQGLRLRFAPLDPLASEAERLAALGPLDALRVLAFGWAAPEGAPPLRLLGMLGYDFLETFEALPAARADRLETPDLHFELPELLLRVDHLGRQVEIEVHGYGSQDADPVALDVAAALLARVPDADPRPPALRKVAQAMPAGLRVDLDDATYCERVRVLKRHIVAGDVFQIVPSRSFSLDCPDGLAAYGALRQLNPSPYLFYLAAEGFSLFGSSPETCLRVEPGPRRVTLFPIAGTRPRGRAADGSLDLDLDNRLEAELKLHGKELAEHMMLVDLARNDVARISVPGSRRVARLLEIERYSHVMHLVSMVQGELRPGLDALHAYVATMNMGTLVGAPKVEAARLLRRHEADRRGPYGGAVGYLGSDGELDTAIVIRSAVLRGGVATVRAGAGVVYDSDPQAEADETRAKANAVLQAIAAAQGGAA